MMVHEALIHVFGRPKAEKIYDDCYLPELTAFHNKTVFDYMEFCRAIDLPKNLTLEEFLIDKCLSNNEIIQVISNALIKTHSVEKKEVKNDYFYLSEI
jgi:hypothetical protein